MQVLSLRNISGIDLQRKGLDAVFNCSASGLGISWFHENQEVRDSGRFHIESLVSIVNEIFPITASTLTIQQTEVEDSGTYECRTPCDQSSATLSILSKQLHFGCIQIMYTYYCTCSQ